MPMAPPGYADAEIVFWWISLGMALVVLLVVILLLSFLVRLVKDIDSGVATVRDTLQSIAGNTSNTTLIGDTAEAVDAVLDEGLTHHLFLGRKVTGSAVPPIGRNDQQ